MKFPRGYLVIDGACQLPPVETLRIWCQSEEPVYLAGISEFDDYFHMQTVDFLRVHDFIDDLTNENSQLVIFHGTKVSEMMLMAVSGHYKKIYWADSQEHLNEIEEMIKVIEKNDDFVWAFDNTDEALRHLSHFIKFKTGQPILGQEAYRQGVSALRTFGNKLEPEVALRKIAKAITRAGVLRRIDLEGEVENTTDHQMSDH